MASTNLISAGWSLLSNCFAPRVLSILSILEGAIVNSSYEDPLVEKQNNFHKTWNVFLEGEFRKRESVLSNSEKWTPASTSQDRSSTSRFECLLRKTSLNSCDWSQRQYCSAKTMISRLRLCKIIQDHTRSWVQTAFETWGNVKAVTFILTFKASRNQWAQVKSFFKWKFWHLVTNTPVLIFHVLFIKINWLNSCYLCEEGTLHSWTVVLQMYSGEMPARSSRVKGRFNLSASEQHVNKGMKSWHVNPEQNVDEVVSGE